MKLPIPILAMMIALPVQAGFQIDQVTTAGADCSAPDVASSPDGLTMVAFGLDGYPLLMHFAAAQLVPTHPSPGETWPEPVILGSGGLPKVCWSREGFIVAVNSEVMILVYESDLEGSWALTREIMLNPGAPVMSIDLCGVPDEVAGPYAFLTVQVYCCPPDGGYRVLYAEADAVNGWSDFEVVAEVTNPRPNPQITYGLGPAGALPIIYYLTDELGGVDLVYTTRDPAAGWDAPTIVPGGGEPGSPPIEGPFDVVTSYGMTQNVLGLGPQPTCPCGSIHYLAGDLAGGWSPPVDMTVPYMDYDWPQPPTLGANPTDSQGQVHAFWMQIGSGNDLVPKTKTLEYKVKTAGGWVDAGGFLDGQGGGPLGESVALDVSPANSVVMAWTRRDTIDGVPQPVQVWMARAGQPAAVPGPGSTPAAASLQAWPNPFNPRVTLSMRAPVLGPAALDVFDVRGRHVVRLFEGDLGAETKDVAWDGCSSAGRQMPSGVYFAMLTAGRDRMVAKILLAE